MNKYCQSCGMPMKRDPEAGGTNADGSKNEMYCSYCYQSGKFTQPEITTAAQMQEFCVEKMKEMGFPRIIGRFFTRNVPKLERWKQKE